MIGYDVFSNKKQRIIDTFHSLFSIQWENIDEPLQLSRRIWTAISSKAKKDQIYLNQYSILLIAKDIHIPFLAISGHQVNVHVPLTKSYSELSICQLLNTCNNSILAGIITPILQIRKVRQRNISNLANVIWLVIGWAGSKSNSLLSCSGSSPSGSTAFLRTCNRLKVCILPRPPNVYGGKFLTVSHCL